MTSIDRREVLRLGAVASVAALTVGGFPSPAKAAPKSVSFDECQAMSPEQMAQASEKVQRAWKALQHRVSSIKNQEIRSAVQTILNNPAPTLLKGIGQAERTEVYQELGKRGLLTGVSEQKYLPPAQSVEKSPQPFLSAPGSGYGSHHAYPGGLVTHTALNTLVSQALYEGYRDIYSFDLDQDTVLASQILHDLHKPWVFQWQEDGSSLPEQRIAGTGAHHVLSVAESIKRGIPAEICVAQACAHNHPRTPKDEEQVVGWIKAACVIAGVSPVKYGMLSAHGDTLPMPRRMEGFVTHLGDHDYILTVPAAQWIVPQIQKVAIIEYGLSPKDSKGKKFNQLRNYVFSQASIMDLYHTYSTQGMSGLSKAVKSIVAA
ncbi:MAG: metal-dependent phosphohydrolase [Desulfovibrio sp.]|uniref:metal-dependent phosphohydrolase n=1 Tax=Desulfovibrio sp. 7SRBS1 TaxID=3378064 RepID=UPI003B3F33FE